MIPINNINPEIEGIYLKELKKKFYNIQKKKSKEFGVDIYLDDFINYRLKLIECNFNTDFKDVLCGKKIDFEKLILLPHSVEKCQNKITAVKRAGGFFLFHTCNAFGSG